METIKKVLHPKESAHHKDNDPQPHPPTSQSQPLPPDDARPDQETLERLGDEPNVTGANQLPPHEDFPPAHNTSTTTTTGDQPKINRGHHHPRQPVGATGTPAGHGVVGAGAGAGAGASGSEAGVHEVKAGAERGNNFPGTNPNPSHSA